MQIVKATASDIDELIIISRDTFYESFYLLNTPENMQAYMDHAFTRPALLAELQNELVEFYFAKKNENVVGYIKVNRSGAQSEFNDGSSLELERLYIDSAYQGNGVGTLLLNKAKELAASLNLKYIWLGVWEMNPGAIRFYLRHGFESYGRHEFIMGDEVQWDHLMKYDV